MNKLNLTRAAVARWKNGFKAVSIDPLERRVLYASIVVNSTSDTATGAGVMTLRQAVAQANANTTSPVTITFDPTVFATAQTITLASGEIFLSNSAEAITITGPSAGVTIDGNQASRVFYVQSGVTASLSNVTITHGSDTVGGGFYSVGNLTLSNAVVTSNSALGNNSVAGTGGGIDSAGGTLALMNVTVSKNNASAAALAFEGIAGNAAGINIKNTSATISNSTIANNTSTGDSAGIDVETGTTTITGSTIEYNTASITGGGVANNGTLIIDSSTIVGNVATAASGGGVYTNSSLTMDGDTIENNTADTGGGICNNSATFQLTNSTVFGNKATGLGGGGLDDSRGTAILYNDTIANNSATGTQTTYYGHGGGILAGGGDPTSLTNVTLSGNSAIVGGGISNATGRIAFTIANTIIAGNTATTSAPDVDDATYGVTSSGYNLIGKIDGSSGWVASDKTGTAASPLDPMLAALANNGGPTLTQLPQTGSPAIDAGSNALIPSGVMTDQRGDARIVNSTVDIGAVETAAAPSVAVQSFTVDNGSAQRSRVRTLTLAFTAPVTLDANAIALSRTTGGTTAVTYSTFTSDGGTTYVVTPTSGLTGGSLIDGNYSLTLNPSGVHPKSNPTASLSGWAQTFTFFRLFGDSNGDGTVNLVDYRAFASSFLKSSGTTGYNFEFDSNNDGTINLSDYRAFAANFLKSITT